MSISACKRERLWARVKLFSVILFDRQSAHPFEYNYTVLYMFLSVCLPVRILSLYVSVHPSVCEGKDLLYGYISSRLYVTLSVCMFSFRPSVHSTVRPSTRLVVGPSARMQFSSLMHVCMSVIFLISNSGLLTSYLQLLTVLTSMFILGCVCVRTRVYGRCVHAYELSVSPCIHPADHFFVFKPTQ